MVAAAPAATIYDAAERAGEARRGHGLEISTDDDGRAVKMLKMRVGAQCSAAGQFHSSRQELRLRVLRLRIGARSTLQ